MPTLPPSSPLRLVSSFATSRLALRTSTPGTFLLRSLRSGSFSPSCYRGPVPSFRTSHLLSRSSVNKRTRAKEESKAFRVSPLPAVYYYYYYFFFFFHFLVSSPAADFRKVKQVATMGKAACPLSNGNGIIRPYERSAIASHTKSVAFADCKYAGISFAHRRLIFAARRKLS